MQVRTRSACALAKRRSSGTGSCRVQELVGPSPILPPAFMRRCLAPAQHSTAQQAKHHTAHLRRHGTAGLAPCPCSPRQTGRACGRRCGWRGLRRAGSTGCLCPLQRQQGEGWEHAGKQAGDRILQCLPPVGMRGH